MQRSIGSTGTTVSRMKYYSMSLLFASLNIFTSSIVQLVEVFNEKLRIAKYVSVSPTLEECVRNVRNSETGDLNTMHCWEAQPNVFDVYSKGLIDDYSQTKWNTPSNTTNSYFSLALNMVNDEGSQAFFIGSIVGFILSFIIYHSVKRSNAKFNMIFSFIIIVSNIAVVALHILLLNKNIPMYIVKSTVSFLIVSRGVIGATISLFNYYVNINAISIFGAGEEKIFRVRCFGALQTISGTMAFLAPMVFNYVYLNYEYLVFIAFISFGVFATSLIVLVMNFLLKEKPTKDENSLELEEFPMGSKKSLDFSPRDFYSYEEQEKQEEYKSLDKGESSNSPALQMATEEEEDLFSSIKKIYSGFSLILLFYPIFVFLSGINLFLYYKDIIIPSTYGISSGIILSGPLVGGILMLFIAGKSIDMRKFAIFGFIAVGIFEILLYCIKQNLFSIPLDICNLISTVLIFLILSSLNCAIIPLSGVLPHYIGKPSSFILMIYGLLTQVFNLLCFMGLTALYKIIGMKFLLVSGVSMFLGGIFTKFLLKGEKIPINIDK